MAATFTFLLWVNRGDVFAAIAPSGAAMSREMSKPKPLPVIELAGETRSARQIRMAEGDDGTHQEDRWLRAGRQAGRRILHRVSFARRNTAGLIHSSWRPPVSERRIQNGSSSSFNSTRSRNRRSFADRALAFLTAWRLWPLVTCQAIPACRPRPDRPRRIGCPPNRIA